MPIPMRCCHIKHKGETWTLDFPAAGGAEVRDPSGAVRGSFDSDEMGGSMLMPSFSESIKQFRVLIDDQLWYFDVAKDDLKTIKEHLDRNVVAAGPEAIDAVRSKAWRDTLIGMGCTILGVGLTAFSFTAAVQQGGDGSYVVCYGLVLFGFIMIGRGIYGFLRHRKLNASATRSELPG